MGDGERLLRAMGRSAREDEVLEPLGPEFEDRMVARLQQQLADKAPPAPAARPLPDRRRSVPWPWLGLAAAAVLAFAVLAPWWAQVPDLDLVGATGRQAIRGDDALGSGVVLAPGAGFRLRLAPRDGLHGPLRVRAFLSRGPRPEPPLDELAITWRRASTGMLEVAGEVAAGPAAEAGPRRLVVAVGRPWSRWRPATPPREWRGKAVVVVPVVHAAK